MICEPDASASISFSRIPSPAAARRANDLSDIFSSASSADSDSSSILSKSLHLYADNRVLSTQ